MENSNSSTSGLRSTGAGDGAQISAGEAVDPTIPQLRAVIAVVDEGSFTAAAEALGISQPSLSRRIHTLEETIGLALFSPAGREMVLTDAGRRITGTARTVLGEIGAIGALCDDLRRQSTGSLRLAGLPSIVGAVLPELAGRFHRRHPGVRIEISALEDAEQLVEALRLGRVDAAVGPTIRLPEDIAMIALPAQRFAAVLPAGVSPADTPVNRAELDRRTLVTLPRATSIREVTDAVYRSSGAIAPRVITTTQRDALVPMAIAAEGVTIVPVALARTAPVFGGQMMPLAPPVHRELGILHLPSAVGNPAARAFLSEVAADQEPGTVR